MAISTEISSKPSKTDVKRFLSAAQDGKRKTLCLILSKFGEAVVDVKNEDGWTALMFASINGHDKLVTTLINANANINSQNKDGCTALILAFYNRHYEVVWMLIDAGANLEAQSKDGWTSLMLASCIGHRIAVSVLFEAGANINARNKYGWTALMIAGYFNCFGVLSTLLRLGAKTEATDNDGWTVLILACKYSHHTVVSKLVQANANIEVQNNYGWTPLMIAGYFGCKEVVPELLKAGANPDTQDKDGETALMKASALGHYDIVVLLLNFKANIEVQNNKGKTAFDLAEDDNVRLLIQSKLNLKPRDSSSSTLRTIEVISLLNDLNDQQNLLNTYEVILGETIFQSRACEMIRGMCRGSIVAVKVLNSIRIARKLTENLLELSLIPYIPKIVGYSSEPRLSIVMEYVSGGTLSDLLRSDRDIPWEQRVTIASAIVTALTHLHCAGFIYGDLTSSKILMGEELQPKLCLSTGLLLDHPPSPPTDKIPWMAPELFQKNAVCTKQSDVYSLGLVLLEISLRFEFSSGKSVDSLIRDIPEDCPDALSSLIASCCQSEPSNRPDTWTIYHLWQNSRAIHHHCHGLLSLHSVLFKKIPGIQSEKHLLDNNFVSIDKGSFGEVYWGFLENRKVAVKVFYRELTDKARQEFLNEVQILKIVRHPNIVPIFGYCYEPNKECPFRCIVMKYMPQGSLYNILHSEVVLSWEIKMGIAKDIACGLMYLHEKDILHRDIKSLNVVLDGNFRSCLCDFGRAVVLHEAIVMPSQGSLPWMAPELHKGGGSTKESDVYSFGTTLWELAARKIPFEAITSIPATIPYHITQGKRDRIPEKCPQPLADVISNCWDGDAKKRPAMRKVVQMLCK